MYYLYTGGYGGEITCYDWSEKSYSTLWRTTSSNPSYLAFHPSLATLYSANELSDSIEISAYSYTDKTCALLNSVTTQGAGLCHVTASENAVYGAAYDSGHVVAFSLNPDGSIGKALNHIKHLGHGSHKRQEAAHAHQCVLAPLKKFLIAVDLGTNSVYSYPIKNDGSLDELNANTCLLPPSEGPRHLVFSKSGAQAYLITEMLNKVYKLSYSNGEFKILDRIELIAPKEQITSAAIDFYPNSDVLFTSLRGANRIISLSTQKLNIKNDFDCMGDSPRMFAFSPDGKFLFIANQMSNSVNIFSVDGDKNIKYHSKIDAKAVSFVHCTLI